MDMLIIKEKLIINYIIYYIIETLWCCLYTHYYFLNSIYEIIIYTTHIIYIYIKIYILYNLFINYKIMKKMSQYNYLLATFSEAFFLANLYNTNISYSFKIFYWVIFGAEIIEKIILKYYIKNPLILSLDL